MAVLRVRPSRPGDIADQIDKFAKRSRAFARREVQRIARDSKRDMIEKRLSGRPGLNRRSGRLAKSLRVRVETLAETVRINASIGSGVRYARVHEFGAVIRPVRAKMLAIPLPPVLNAKGLARFKSPRQQSGLFIIKSKRGNLLLVKRTPSGIEPQWVLKSSVRIPARLRFTRTMMASFRRGVRRMGRAWRALARRGGR